MTEPAKLVEVICAKDDLVCQRSILRRERGAVRRAVRHAFPGLNGRSYDDCVVSKPSGHCLSFPYISEVVRLNEEARDARQTWAGNIPSRHKRLWETDARIGKWTKILQEALNSDHRDTAFSVVSAPLVKDDLPALWDICPNLTIKGMSYVILAGHADMVFMAETIVEDATPLYEHAALHDTKLTYPSMIATLIGITSEWKQAHKVREWTRVAMIPCEKGCGCDLARALSGHMGGTRRISDDQMFNMLGFASEAPFADTEPDGTPKTAIEFAVLSAMRKTIALRLSGQDKIGRDNLTCRDMEKMTLADAWGADD
jgi:hypothetical protein